MKYILLSCLFLAFNFDVNSQASIIHTRMNVLYQGIDNNVSIIYSSRPEDTKISVSMGKLTKQGNGYIYSSTKLGTVYFTIKSKDGLTFTQSLRIKELPRPFFKIDDFENRILSKENLIDIKELKGRLLDFEYFIQPVISSFNIKVIKHNGKIKKYKNKSNSFNNNFLSYCLDLKENDIIIFSDIRYDYIFFPGEKQEKFIKKGKSESIVFIIQ